MNSKGERLHCHECCVQGRTGAVIIQHGLCTNKVEKERIHARKGMNKSKS